MSAPVAESSLSFEYVRQLVRDRAAIVLEENKGYLVDARLGPLATKEGFRSVEELVRALRSQRYGPLHKSVVEAMTTNETFFFRDRAPFEALREQILPVLVQARRSSRQLHIWSAAASSGQEAYSVLMLLKEHFPELDTWQVQLLGSDISREVLEKARAGRYTQLEVNRGLPAHLLTRFFEHHGLEWRIKPALRDMLRLEEINLIEPWPPLPRFDVIFLRNVLIYFDVPTKRRILERVRGVMAPDGYLFLGGAETTLGVDEQLIKADYPNANCYRLRGR